MDVAGLALTGAVAAAIVIPELLWLRRRARRRSPFGVVGRLRGPGDTYQVSTSAFDSTGIWNPGEPWGLKNPLYGPGVGVYRMEDDGEVVLDWTPKYGSPGHFKGPIPPRLLQGARLTPTARRVAWVVVASYVTGTVGGFTFGWAMGSGSDRSGTAFGGATLGFVAAYACLLAARPLFKRLAHRQQPQGKVG